jgi:hypothetical protein
MSELSGTVLVGLPNIRRPEAAYLESMLRNGDEQTSLIMEAVTDTNPLINFVIDYDCEYFHQNEAKLLGLSELDADVYGYGIELGYQFIVGCMTAVHIAKSGFSDIKEYLAHPEIWKDQIPVLSIPELVRVKHVREGKALLDPIHRGFPATSTDLADEHFSRYLCDLEGFNKLYDDYCTRICGGVDNSATNAMMNGFHSGSANAVEMYVQSAEERLFQQSDSQRN